MNPKVLKFPSTIPVMASLSELSADNIQPAEVHMPRGSPLQLHSLQWAHFLKMEIKSGFYGIYQDYLPVL